MEYFLSLAQNFDFLAAPLFQKSLLLLVALILIALLRHFF
jgi:hypothetical protein